jgi:DNA-binding IscR family transcriptional regulator
MAFLQDNGASSVPSISGGTGVPRESLRSVLKRLADDGCVTKSEGLWRPLEGP